MLRPALIAIIISNLLAAIGVLRLSFNIFDRHSDGTILYDFVVFSGSVVLAVLAEKTSEKNTYVRVVAEYTIYFSLSFLFLIFMLWFMNL